MKPTSEQIQECEECEEYEEGNSYDIIKEIIMCTEIFPDQDAVDDAISIAVGCIENRFIYRFVTYDELIKLGKINQRLFAIQVNNYLFAIPLFINNEDKLCIVPLAKTIRGRGIIVNYTLANSICSDLNNILKVCNIDVEFKGIVDMKNGRIRKPQDFYCNIKHTPVNIDQLVHIADVLCHYYQTGEGDEREIFDYLEFLRVEEHDTTMTFIEYVEFVKEVTGFDIFSIPPEFK